MVTDGKNSPREIFTSCLAAFKFALSAFNFELFLKASDNVLITSGSAEANFLSVMTQLDPGDEIIYMVPNY